VPSASETPVIPAILTQPASQTVPLTQTATFTVVAENPTPVTFQWLKDGAVIPGATSPSYAISSAALADSGSVFTVTLSNSVGSVTSNKATLTVGARSPKPGDLRFKLVDYTQSLIGTASSNIIGTSAFFADNSLGSPLEVGSAGACGGPGSPIGDCAWRYYTFSLPPGVTGININYTAGNSSTFSSDLAALASSGVVVNSFDEQPAEEVYGLGYLTVTPQSNQPAGFSQAFHTVALGALQAAAAQEATQSRVITAVCLNPATGLVDYVSYGWLSDTTTQFETSVVVSTFTSVESDAAQLAAEGYIVTATGAGLANGFVLVGTRVQGDTLPRGFRSIAFPGDGSTLNGLAPVGVVFDSKGNGYLSEN
jgi:hypothetical protein